MRVLILVSARTYSRECVYSRTCLCVFIGLKGLLSGVLVLKEFEGFAVVG